MLTKTDLQDAAYDWMKGLSHGSHFEHTDTYRFLETHFADECRERGDAQGEPRYKNDARWAAQDALGRRHGKKKIIEEAGRGRFRRL